MQSQLHSLTQINLDDLVAALGLLDQPRAARVARLILRRPAMVFARRMLELDAVTGEKGLVAGARHAQRLLAREVRVFGREQLPAGGFLALSNHPGLTDTLALFAALDRTDLKIIALQRPFLSNLVNVSRHLVYLPESASGRAALVRHVARTLRAGAAVLTFPAGSIEPDPGAFPGAVESLNTWNESAEVFAKLAPGIPIFPVCVRGVTWVAAARHPFLRIRRSPPDHQLLVSAVQLVWQLISGSRLARITVQIGNPIHIDGRRQIESNALHRTVLNEMRKLIQNPPRASGVSAL